MHALLIWYNTTSLTSIYNFSRGAFAFYTLHIFVTNKPPIDYRWVKHSIMHHRFYKRIAQYTWSGNRLNIKLLSYPYRISHHKIRRAEDRLIFIMEILYPRKVFILRRIFLDLFLVKFYVTKQGRSLILYRTMHRCVGVTTCHIKASAGSSIVGLSSEMEKYKRNLTMRWC